jgi:hypothetical protein
MNVEAISTAVFSFIAETSVDIVTTLSIHSLANKNTFLPFLS